MSTSVIINIAIEIFCSVLCSIFILCILVGDSLKIRLTRVFVAALSANIAVMMSDALVFYSIGKMEPIFFTLNFAGNFSGFLFSYVIVMCFANYLNVYIGAKFPVRRTSVYIVYGVSGLGIALTFLSLLNNMYFIIDENNIYHRQSLNWLAQMLGIIGIAVNGYVIIRHFKKLNRVEKFALASYIVLLVAGVFIQMLFYGLVVAYIASTTTIALIYVGMQSQYAKTMKEKEVALMESRISIMPSQIQPHFLYNTLTTIENLCYNDSELAAKLVRDFSGYLRENMDSLTQKELVSFGRELEHVRIYLGIEKLRFEERLNVIYNLEVTDFNLPILTVQPLVENAVRYGVTKKLYGGTVSISTRRVPEGIKIIVSDDGVGFEQKKPKPPDGRSHIGMENVRERVSSQIGGTLTVESAEGKGTVCTIMIPRKKEGNA